MKWASSLLLAWTLTVEVTGPSLNVTSKLPAPVMMLKDRFETAPTEPP